jgi:AraC-like DNA-binding protein
VRESRPPGPVRGAPGNGRPYRDTSRLRPNRRSSARILSISFAVEHSMDPLSDACLSLNVKSVDSALIHVGGCWAARIPACGDIAVGASLKGSDWLSIDGLDHPILIQEGDCYLIANPLGAHHKSSEPDMEAADLGSPLAQSVIWPTEVMTRHVVTRYPGECDHTLIGARLVFEERPNCLFDLLPPIIHIPANSDVAPVFRSMLHVLAGENAAREKLGATVTTNHLARILLVQALRTYVAVEDCPRGWLGALVDAKIGAALALMHRHSARQWTVEDLAAAVRMSRSSFALRFKTVVGQAPLDYWLQWRMHRAGHMLRNSNATVSSVAFAFGYESESSFGKAFKRVMGCAPTSYRMAGRMRSIAPIAN